MAYISEELMNEVWQTVGAMNGDGIRAMQKRHQKEQKTLTKVVYGPLLELGEDAGGVGMYAFHVILEAFSRLVPRPAPVRRPVIEWNRDLPADVLAEKACLAEPHATQYLQDALTEEDDEVALSEVDRAVCSQVIQVAILSLHQACARRKRCR